MEHLICSTGGSFEEQVEYITIWFVHTLCGMCLSVGNPGKYTSSETLGNNPYIIFSIPMEKGSEERSLHLEK